MKLIATTALISMMASAFTPLADAAGYTCGIQAHFGIDSEVDHAHEPTIEELNFSRRMFMKTFHDVHPDLSFDKVDLMDIFEEKRLVASMKKNDAAGLRGASAGVNTLDGGEMNRLTWDHQPISWDYSFVADILCPYCFFDDDDDDDFYAASASSVVKSLVHGGSAKKVNAKAKKSGAEKFQAALTEHKAHRWETAWCDALKNGPHEYYRTVDKCVIAHDSFSCTEKADAVA